MKSSILSLLSLSTLASAMNMETNPKLPRVLKEHPTKRTPLTLNTAHGRYKLGEFISLMEQRPGRSLQVDPNNVGGGNDPTQCNVDGEYFTCVAPNAFTSGSNLTNVVNTVRCELDSAIGVDFQARPEACTCSANLKEGARVRDCACSVCPYGRAQAVALDCSVVTEDPYLTGTCVSLDCDGRCNGTGLGVVNQPTPAPGGEGDPAPTPSGVNPLGTMVGLVLGTVVSFVSVYCV